MGEGQEFYSEIRHNYCPNCCKNQLCEMTLEHGTWQGICLTCSQYVYKDKLKAMKEVYKHG